MDDRNFYSLLNEFVDQCGKTKNRLVRETGIDRSNFFQILKGKRVPTAQQFGAVLMAGLDLQDSFQADPAGTAQKTRERQSISPDADQPAERAQPAERNQPEEKDEPAGKDQPSEDLPAGLLESFLRLRLEEEDYRNWKLVQDFLDETNSSLQSAAGLPAVSGGGRREGGEKQTISRADQAVAASIDSFLQETFLAQDPCLDFYLSSSLVDSLHLASIITEHTKKTLSGKTVQPALKGARPRIRQIVGVPSSASFEVIRILLHHLSQIPALLSAGGQLSVYQAPDPDLQKSTQLYPYYFISQSSVLLISRDGVSCAAFSDRDLVGAYRQQFDETVRKLPLMLVSFDHYMELTQALIAGYQRALEQNTEIYGIAERPCSLQMLQGDIVDRHIADTEQAAFLKEYIRIVQSLPGLYTFLSEDGLQDFERDQTITESGANVRLDEKDLEEMNRHLSQNLGKNQMLVPFRQVFLREWQITVHRDTEVFLNIFDRPDCIIRILDKGVVQAIYRYYDILRRILQRVS